MKVLVTFALENEFAPWREMHDFQPGEWGAGQAYFAEVGEAEVGVVLTGVGAGRNGVKAPNAPWRAGDSIGCCISSGFAGALKAHYRVGQVLAARKICSEDIHAGASGKVLTSSEPLFQIATESGAMPVESFYSSNHMVGTSEEKRRLGSSYDAVEMESFSVMLESFGFGVPSIAIRAISDGVDEDLPLDLSRILDERGQVSRPRVFAEVVRHPQAIPGLIRLGQNSKRGAEALARFLDHYVAAVARSPEIAGTKVVAASQ